MKLVSVVIPVYHNARSLHDLLARLSDVANEDADDFEFIFVDDGSKDDSFDVLQELTTLDERVRVVKLARNFGANAASTAGIAHSRGDAVVAISADLQDPPELLPQMLAKWREGFRVVLAARSGRRDGFLTRVTSGLFWKLFRRFALSNMPEHGCDYCLVDRHVLDSLKDTHEPNAGIGMLIWAGFEPAIIYYERQKREARYGRSMWSLSKKITYLIDLFVSFSHVPVRAASVMGILLAMLGIVYALLVIHAKLIGSQNFDEGWASLMVVILIAGGSQLITIGILGEYLIRTLEASRRRPPFIVDRVIESSPSIDAKKKTKPEKRELPVR